MVDRNSVCKACDGSGLLADDENWQYNCTVCGGDGVVLPGESNNKMVDVDQTNRTLE